MSVFKPTFLGRFDGIQIESIHFPFASDLGEPSCIYLLHKDDQWLMVDAGMCSEVSAAALTQLLRERGINGANLTVLVTHMHMDHSGLLNSLPEKSVVYMHEQGYTSRLEDEKAKIQEDFLNLMLELGIREDEALQYQADNEETTRVEDGRFFLNFVKDGQKIAWAGEVFQVRYALGHAPCQVVFYEPRRQLLFSGDVVLEGRTPCVELGFGQDSMAQYFAALDLVESMQIFRVFPGHGSPMAKPQVAKAAQRIRQRKFKVVKAYAELAKANPEATAYELCQLFLLQGDLRREGSNAAPDIQTAQDRWRQFGHYRRYFALLEAVVALRHLGEMPLE